MTYTSRKPVKPRICAWDVIVQGWWSRCSARDARKRTRTCITEFGIAVPTQVRALTRHSISFKKPLKPNTSECFWLKGVVPRSWTLQDTKLGFWRQFDIFGDGSGTHSDPRIRARGGLQTTLLRVCQTVLGKPCNAGSGTVRGLMNSLKPAGG